MPKLDCQIDYTNLNRMIKDLNRLESTEVSAGFDSTPHSSGLTNAELANILEKGVRDPSGGMRTPPRPFMKQGGDIWSNSIDKESRLVVENTLNGKANVVNKYLEIIADEGKESIQSSIELQNFAPLKPSTVKIKRDKGSRYVTELLLEEGELFEGIVTEVK